MSVIAMTVFLRTEMKVGTVIGGSKFLGALFFSLINVMFNGIAELALTIFRFPVFFRQRDFLFYPAWAFSLPIFILRIPLSFIESGIWTLLTYYTIGFAPSLSRFFKQFLAFFATHQTALSLFRLMAAIGRTLVVAKVSDCSPFPYRWNVLHLKSDAWNNQLLFSTWLRLSSNVDTKTRKLLFSTWLRLSSNVDTKTRKLLFSTWLRLSSNVDTKTRKLLFSTWLRLSSNVDTKTRKLLFSTWLRLSSNVDTKTRKLLFSTWLRLSSNVDTKTRKLLFSTWLRLSSNVDTKTRKLLFSTWLRLSSNVDTKTRKLLFSTWLRLSSNVDTKTRKLLFSTWLRLSSNVDTKTRKMFVEEVMELIELDKLRDALVGLPGVDGLSTEQRKRLTIAVELVANPSIIFMDEPTSGLDARSAAIVMRTVRNTVDTGRTVVCTIHQPSIDIFEAFDELLLMKRGGQMIYAGPLGERSCKLIEYFEAIPGIPKIENGKNPATWMLEVTAPPMEAQLDIDFADTFAKSPIYRRNQELIMELSTPAPGSKDLHFPTEYSQSFFFQCRACFWKQHRSYWRHTQYNAIRFFSTIVVGILFGLVFWNKGQILAKQQDVLNVMGAIYSAIIFLGASNASSVQSVVAIERTAFYREKAAGMYSALPYAFAQVAIETIYVFVQSIIYSLIIYSMIGFEWKLGKFLLFCYLVFMCFTYFTLYGMMVVALTPNYHIAAIVMSFFVGFWNLFTGFLIPRPAIPVWWRWYYWANPVAWTIYGIVASQVGDKDSLVQIPGVGSVRLKLFLKEGFGYEHDFIPIVIAAHFIWVLVFIFVFAYGIKYLNFQRR
uniref:ABC transporter domain-containing protein n=1 Tax=Cucumis sativus TaxID=3659 RepID=A0A0A0LDZ6_CUCSA